MIDKVVHKWLGVPHVLHVGNDLHPRGAEITVVFIHGLGNSHVIWKDIIGHIANDKTRVITVDLLGFGDSPKPAWQSYGIGAHAQALHMTLRTRYVTGPVILVGHSLGALVAVHYTTLFPHRIRSLLLCSPPFYREAVAKKRGLPSLTANDLYSRVANYSKTSIPSERAEKIATALKRARIIDPTFIANNDTLPAIISSLEMSIANQRVFQEALELRLPIHVIYGKLDPFITKKHIRTLEAKSPNVTLETIIAGHEIAISKSYTKAIIAAVKRLLHPDTDT